MNPLKIFSHTLIQLQRISERQRVLANNIANADRSSFKARDVALFMGNQGVKSAPILALREPNQNSTLRKGLLSGPLKVFTVSNANQEAGLSGSNVNLEDEMKKINETGLLHQQVLAIYREYNNQFMLIL